MIEISRDINQSHAPAVSSNEPELVILPIDPYHLYAYWNFGGDFTFGTETDHAWHDLALRIYWLPDDGRGGEKSKLWFDVMLQKHQTQHKVRLPINETAYSAAIGRCCPKYGFSPFAYSNVIRVPRGEMAAWQCEEDSPPPQKSGRIEEIHRIEKSRKIKGPYRYDEETIDVQIRKTLRARGIQGNIDEMINTVKKMSGQGLSELEVRSYDAAAIDGGIENALSDTGDPSRAPLAINSSEDFSYASQNPSGKGLFK
ncbi:MAG: DUF4912 domain-containing protein [Gammaproteobacteria bacterium]